MKTVPNIKGSPQIPKTIDYKPPLRPVVSSQGITGESIK
jgi:hypothetical protein